jgi:hypothetical protein
VFAGVYGFTQGIGGGVAEFFQQGGCGVKEQAPAGFAAAGGHALFGCCCFGFGFGALGGHPQFEGQCFELFVFGGELVGVLEWCGWVGQEVVEGGLVAVAFVLQACVVFG